MSRPTHFPIPPEASCFHVLEPAALAALTQRALRVSVMAGRRIFRPGEKVAQVFCLLAGSVRISTILPDRTGPLLDLLAPPALLGVHEAMRAKPTAFDVRALEDCELLAIPAELFIAWTQQQPRFAYAVTLELAHQLEEMGTRVGPLTEGQVTQRLARLLLVYAETCGTPAPTGTRLRARLSQQSLAADLDVDRQSITRAIETLRVRGLLEKSLARFQVTSTEALRAFVGLAPNASRNLPGVRSAERSTAELPAAAP